MRRRGMALETLLLAALLGCGGDRSGGGGEAGAAPARGAAGSGSPAAAAAAGAATDREPGGSGSPAAAGLGEGFVVWESNRTGAWRIWTRRLDGGGPTQLSPDEPGRQHCCPHIAPDGRRVVYLSTEVGLREYPAQDATGALRVRDLEGGGDRVAVDGARTYFENRVAVWRDPGTLVYIAADGRTFELDLDGGGRRPLVTRAPERHGWLINSTLTHATSGQPTFSVFLPERREVAPRPQLGGCQPFFSHDGRWGYWVAGAGGPINRIDLASRAVSTILEKSDPRMPDGFGYAYFPMLSRDGLLFAYAASQGEHDHFRSNYEVFVAETDPGTLEVLGEAVRMTDHPASDRFPDVFLAPLPLGRRFVEAPHTLELRPADGGSWEWDFGDGATGSGETGRHLFARPGSYTVEARRGGEVRRGRVVVAAARPPRVIDVGLLDNGAAVVVRFDEPVRSTDLVARFASGRQVGEAVLAPDGRSLRLALPEPLRRPDRLTLAGIEDRAQRPNPLPETVLEVAPPRWPSRREGLVFLWETGEAANLVEDRFADTERAFTLQATGRARLDGHWAMVLDGGAFAVGEDEASYVRYTLQGTNELTLEATLRPRASPREPAEIVSFARRGRGQNFRLVQHRDRLAFGLRAGGKDADRWVELFALPPGRASHLAVTFEPGRLRAYLDGEPRVDSDAIQGDFFHWRSHPLVFGGGPGGADWRGTLEGVAIYSRVLEPAEVAENALRYREKLARRTPIPRIVVDARLRARSPAPTLQQISPYREALAVSEYEVVRVVSGELAAGRLRVAEWAILDGEALPRAGVVSGPPLRLDLEPFADNPQLESLYLADTLEPAPGVPLLYAPEPAAGDSG